MKPLTGSLELDVPIEEAYPKEHMKDGLSKTYSSPESPCRSSRESERALNAFRRMRDYKKISRLSECKQ